MIRNHRVEKFVFALLLVGTLVATVACSSPTHEVDTDVQLLLSLRTQGYEDLSLEDFMESVREERDGNEGFIEAYQTVQQNLIYEPEIYNLEEQDRDFITITLKCTMDELLAEQQANYSGDSVETAYFQTVELERTDSDGNHNVYLDYYINYTVDVPGAVTVGERDQAVQSIVGPLSTYLETEPLDSLESSGEAITEQLASLSSSTKGPISFSTSIHTFMIDGSTIVQ